MEKSATTREGVRCCWSFKRRAERRHVWVSVFAHRREEKELNLKKTDLIGSTLFAAQSEPIPASLPESGSLMVHVLVVHAADRVSSIIILERKSFNWNTTIYRFRLIHKCDILGGEGHSPLLLSSFISLM